jgi:hypothetical protein
LLCIATKVLPTKHKAAMIRSFIEAFLSMASFAHVL